jgi:hypothetical protein
MRRAACLEKSLADDMPARAARSLIAAARQRLIALRRTP